MPGGEPEPPPGRSPPPAWLQERLFERRVVFITGRLDDAVATRAAAELTMLDTAGEGPIDVYLDSPDGTLEAAFVVIDTLGVLHVPVLVHCRGQVGGPAIGIVTAADRRVASPHTRFRLTQPTGRFSGTADEVASHSWQQRDLLWRLQARIASVTGRPVEEVAADMRRGRYLDAREALAYALVDEIRGSAP